MKRTLGLQYKMFLLKEEIEFERFQVEKDLQYKMFLLNSNWSFNGIVTHTFTIQNVPIKFLLIIYYIIL